MDDRTFTLPELASLVGVEYRTLHTWVRRGLLSGSRAQACGSGTKSIFDRTDALHAYILADLRRAGLRLSRLAEVARELQGSRDDSIYGAELLLINGTVQLTGYDQLAGVVRRASPTLAYDLAHASSGLDQALADV